MGGCYAAGSIARRSDRGSPRPSAIAESAAVAARAAGGGDVRLRHIVHHHAIGAEAPAERTDCALDACDPLAGQAVAVPLVVQRDDRVAKHAAQRLAIAEVVRLRRRVRLAHADGKAVQPVVGLGPPPVEDRQVEPAVEHDFLAAGAAGLQWTPRLVEPDVHTLTEVP